METNEPMPVRSGLSAGTILGWMLVGGVLGLIFTTMLIDIMEVAHPCEGGSACEGMANEVAKLASPLVGGLWGLIAGASAYAIGKEHQSRRSYIGTVTVMLTTPCVVFVVLGLIGTPQLVQGLLLTLGIGVIVWLISWWWSLPLANDVATP